MTLIPANSHRLTRSPREPALSRRCSGAFTFIELIAALALVALLMTVLLTVITGIARGRATMADRTEADPHPRPLTRMLRTDLAHARIVRGRPGYLEMTGYGALDPKTLRATHEPARVIWRLERMGGMGYLLRRQTLLNSRGNRATWSELVRAGVESFSVRLIASGAGIERADQPPHAEREDGARSDLPRIAVPSRAQLTVLWDAEDAPPLRKELVID